MRHLLVLLRLHPRGGGLGGAKIGPNKVERANSLRSLTRFFPLSLSLLWPLKWAPRPVEPPVTHRSAPDSACPATGRP